MGVTPRGRWIAAFAVILGIACGGGTPTTEQSASRTATESSDELSPVAPREAAPAPPTEASSAAPSAVDPVAAPAEDAIALEPAIDAAPSLDPLLASFSLSTSIGGPSNGSIRGALALPEAGPGYRSNALRPNPTAYYGTVELLRALVRAAAVVHEELPGSELVINDIGLPEGGPIPHHGSHQAGRDVDVLFYYLDGDDQPWPSKGVPVDRRGRGWDFADLSDPRDDVRVRLDVPRTWRFVQAMIEHDLAGDGLFQRIFVAEHVRALLLAEAERSRAPRPVRERFEALTCQPGHPHDDHFHFRFFCSVEDVREGCADTGPFYPWRRAQLSEAQVEWRRPTRAPRSRRAPTVTRGEARQSAGRMHSRVTAFLEERATWSVPQHPGRPYCR